MQCLKLVNAGHVDRIIVFDELPAHLVKGIRTREVAGFPRTWAKWLIGIGSLRPVMKTETTQHPDRSYSFKFTPIGKEPCFFVLDYTDLNADKDRWREIGEYLRQTADSTVRLKEKIEDMAIPMAPNSNTSLDIEPEDIPIIRLPKEELIRKQLDDDIVEPHEQIIVQEEPLKEEIVTKKKPGRPRKNPVLI